jgi:hypothetical protein
MKPTTRLSLAAGTGAAALAAVLLVPGQFALTADHFDPPSRTDPLVTSRPDVAADIADVFAFHDATNAYFAVTIHDRNGQYDRDVLYGLNISTSAPATSADIQIRFRFGPATNGTGFGVSVENLPGAGTISGPVETVLSRDVGNGTVQVYAGLRDDPFFFDLQGFRETRAMSTLRFNNRRNFFAGANVIAVVIQIPRSRLGAGPLDVNATSARFGGLLS